MFKKQLFFPNILFMFALGIVLGFLQRGGYVRNFNTMFLLSMQPSTISTCYLAIILFEMVFSMDSRTLTASYRQVLLLGGVGFGKYCIFF